MLSSTNNRLPKLECIIATDDGAVLDLKWCPLGGWCNEVCRNGIYISGMDDSLL